MLSGIGDELITRSEQSCQLWCVQCVGSRNFMNVGSIAKVKPHGHKKSRLHKVSLSQLACCLMTGKGMNHELNGICKEGVLS